MQKLKSLGIATGCALSLLIIQPAQAETFCSSESATCKPLQLAGLRDKIKQRKEEIERKVREKKRQAEGGLSGLSEEGSETDENGMPAPYECHSDEACERMGVDENIQICTHDGECYGDRINEDLDKEQTEQDDNTDDNTPADDNSFTEEDNPFTEEGDETSETAGPSCDRQGNCTDAEDDEDLDGGPGSLPPGEEETLSEKLAAWEAEQQRVKQVAENQREIRRTICSETAEDGSCELEGIMIKSQKVLDRHVYTFITEPYGSVHVAIPESELVAAGAASLFEAADFVKARVVFDVNGRNLNMMILREVEAIK